jgi:hypothetical protein
MGTAVRSTLGWSVVAALAGGVGFGLGALGLLEHRPDPVAEVQLVGSSGPAVPAFDCPGGEQVAQFAPGTRIFVVGRDADATWLVARSPAAGFESVWVRSMLVSVDEFPNPVELLDVVPCDPVVVGEGGDG